jgi:hypothetical protein
MNENNGNRNSENNNKTKFENDLEENFIFRVKKVNKFYFIITLFNEELSQSSYN